MWYKLWPQMTKYYQRVQQSTPLDTGNVVGFKEYCGADGADDQMLPRLLCFHSVGKP